MSDYLAVGGVTAVLKWLLTNDLTAAGPNTVLTSASAITALSPDLIEAGQNEEPQLNLFMYYVSLNPALRNLDLPSYDAAGNRVCNPPLALNLHYLVSAYGSTQTAQLASEILLGWAMKVFHDNPVVPAHRIQDALSALSSQSSAEAKLVYASTLAGQMEHFRITPEALTIEEIYRLWPAFQASYRPSSAFQVSVVVIQDTSMVTSGPPVRHRRLVALPLQSPVITTISPAMATAGQVLTITGANFLGQTVTDTVVSFDNAAAASPSVLRGDLLKVTLPGGLQAGTRMARVQRLVTFPGEASPRRGFTSSPVPFQLLPVIQDASPIQATHGSPLTLAVSPPVGRTQQVTVYVGDQGIPVPGPAPLPGTPATSPTVAAAIPADIPVTGTAAGAGVPIRVEVDGASSLLTQQAGGQWTPLVQVT
jgi:Pvc16 N-terminal domain/IPT/TIG domain